MIRSTNRVPEVAALPQHSTARRGGLSNLYSTSTSVEFKRRFLFGETHGLPAFRQKQVGGIGEPVCLLLGVLEHRRLSLNVLRRVRGLVFNLPAKQLDRIQPVLDLLSLLLEDRSDGCIVGEGETEKLVDVADAHERIAGTNRVIEERERFVLLQRQEPQATASPISTASGFLSTPYKQRPATTRRA